MYSNKFDLWVTEYDETVRAIDECGDYPFAGYKYILQSFFDIAMQKYNANKKGLNILDLGIGTGVLSRRLYESGNKIFGLDFSQKMIECAKSFMPRAEILQWDFSCGLPRQLDDRLFDIVLMTYSLHHLTDSQKIGLIEQILVHLNKDGIVLIGDVCFLTEQDLGECKAKYKQTFDNEEHYIVFDKFVPILRGLLPKGTSVVYEQISHCCGMIVLSTLL